MNEIIEAHWQWVRGFIDSFKNEPEIGLETLEYIYKTAFEHGIKHGVNEQFSADTEKRVDLILTLGEKNQ